MSSRGMKDERKYRVVYTMELENVDPALAPFLRTSGNPQNSKHDDTTRKVTG
jgi:hypothetical protein